MTGHKKDWNWSWIWWILIIFLFLGIFWYLCGNKYDNYGGYDYWCMW